MVLKGLKGCMKECVGWAYWQRVCGVLSVVDGWIMSDLGAVSDSVFEDRFQRLHVPGFLLQQRRAQPEHLLGGEDGERVGVDGPSRLLGLEAGGAGAAETALGVAHPRRQTILGE